MTILKMNRNTKTYKMIKIQTITSVTLKTIAVFCSKCVYSPQADKAHVPQSLVGFLGGVLYCGRTLQDCDVLTLS